MVDIVEIFENDANLFGWMFSYGDRQNRNLLEGNLEVGNIYMLLDPVKRNRLFSKNGGDGGTNFTGSFILGVQSDLDRVYHGQTEEVSFSDRMLSSRESAVYSNPCSNEQGYQVLGKYIKNIKPLLEDQITKLESSLNCSDLTIKGWEVVDIINVLDVNLDGLVVTFTINQF